MQQNENFAKQAEQAEAERPEVVGYLATAEHPKHGQPHKAFNYFKDQHDAQVAHWRERGCEVSDDELMTVAQHARIVGVLRAEIAEWQEAAGRSRSDVVAYIAERAKLLEERDAAMAGVEALRAELQSQRERNTELIFKLGSATNGWGRCEKERDAALARVAELEGQSGFEFVYDSDELVAVPRGLLGAACHAIDKKRYAPRTIAKLREYARGLPAPVAQVQQLNDLDKQCRDDVARALGLRPNQERGFAWSYLLASIKSCVKASGDSAQAQHSVPDGAADLCRFLAKLYCELDGLRYSTAKLPAEQIADALIFKWPVLQGARNQLNIKRISEQPYDESKLHSAIAAMLAAAPAQGGE